MKRHLFGIIMFINVIAVFANEQNCKLEIKGYKVVKKSVYPFKIGLDKTCFFAFYTTNPEPGISARGNGNLGDSLWYGYYKLKNPVKIYEFPKPTDNYWSNVCSIDAVSFLDMNNDNIPDVTVIGSCDKHNAINYTIPLVFIRKNNKYIFNENVYLDLLGFISLTVFDVRSYIKSPQKNYKFLRDRYTLN